METDIGEKDHIKDFFYSTSRAGNYSMVMKGQREIKRSARQERRRGMEDSICRTEEEASTLKK
jgi:hypothetical protein